MAVFLSSSFVPSGLHFPAVCFLFDLLLLEATTLVLLLRLPGMMGLMNAYFCIFVAEIEHAKQTEAVCGLEEVEPIEQMEQDRGCATR